MYVFIFKNEVRNGCVKIMIVLKVGIGPYMDTTYIVQSIGLLGEIVN